MAMSSHLPSSEEQRLGHAEPTRICVLTAEGRGAVSVLRVWGADALSLTDRVFRPARPGSLTQTGGERLRLGRIGGGLGDEVVAVRIEQDPPEVEVHCHGGAAARALVVEAFVAAGAEERRPVAWVRETARSLLHAEAEVDLGQATTVRAAEILLEQVQGALEEEVAAIVARIRSTPELAFEALGALSKRAEVGVKLLPGWRVSLAGKPNVGKSRLLNRLAGYDRAIVDPTPGTTRDVVTLRTAFDGWPVELSDTAGLREAGDAIERSGIALSRARHQEADLVLVVLDQSRPMEEEDQSLLASRPHALMVANKSDLPAVWDLMPGMIATSAEQGDGIDRLAAEIATRLVPAPPPARAGVPFRRAHLQTLREAETRLISGNAAGAADLLEEFLGRSSRRIK